MKTQSPYQDQPNRRTKKNYQRLKIYKVVGNLKTVEHKSRHITSTINQILNYDQVNKNINRNSDKPGVINEQHVEQEGPECFHSVGISKDF